MRDRFVCGRGVTAAHPVFAALMSGLFLLAASPLYAQGTTPTVTVGGGVQAG